MNYETLRVMPQGRSNAASVVTLGLSGLPMPHAQPPPSQSVLRWRYMRYLCLGLGGLATIFICHQSLTPSLSVPSIIYMDKLLHFGAYAVLGVLFRFGLPKIRSSLIAIGLIAIGAGLELLQNSMNLGRTGTWNDAVANSVGAIVGITLASYILNWCFTRGSVQE